MTDSQEFSESSSQKNGRFILSMSLSCGIEISIVEENIDSLGSTNQ
jgi:hypothetical protein